MKDVEDETPKIGLIFENGLSLEVATDRAIWFERKRPDNKSPDALQKFTRRQMEAYIAL